MKETESELSSTLDLEAFTRMSDSLQDSLGSIQPIASTSTSIGQFEERGQSPSQEEKPLDQLDQQVSSHSLFSVT